VWGQVVVALCDDDAIRRIACADAVDDPNPIASRIALFARDRPGLARRFAKVAVARAPRTLLDLSPNHPVRGLDEGLIHPQF
jgi:hypothetical protein